MKISDEDLWDFVLGETERGHGVRLTVNSGSMRPFLHPGEDILLTGLTRRIRKGDIVLARTEQRGNVLHAVKEIKGDEITLQGTANLYACETCSTQDVAAIVADSPKFIRLWPSGPFLRRVLLKIFR